MPGEATAPNLCYISLEDRMGRLMHANLNRSITARSAIAHEAAGADLFAPRAQDACRCGDDLCDLVIIAGHAAQSDRLLDSLRAIR